MELQARGETADPLVPLGFTKEISNPKAEIPVCIETADGEMKGPFR
jgi:hypothetical protein